MRRIWAGRIVIVIAAGASIATSPKRWTLEATRPPISAPAPGRAMAITVEASQVPSVYVVIGEGGSRRLADAPAAWPGRARYFVPAGARVERVEIDGRCSMGLCSGKCGPPDGAYVRVADVAAADGWIAEARSAPVTTVLDPARVAPSYRVTIEASRLPVALEIESSPRHLVPEVRNAASVPASIFHVDWTASNAQGTPVTVTWTARATIQGECAGAAACAAPAGEAVRIRAIEPKAPAEP